MWGRIHPAVRWPPGAILLLAVAAAPLAPAADHPAPDLDAAAVAPVTAAAVADLNGDRRVDLVAGGAGGLLLWLDQGRGAWESYRPPGVPGPVRALATVDLDGRAGAELVTLTSQGLVVLAPAGGREPLVLEAPGGAALVIPLDADGDGRTDLLSAGAPAAALALWLNRPGGPAGYRLERATVDLDAPGCCALEHGVAVDLDGDGVLDVAGVAPDGALTLLRGAGERRFTVHRLPGVPGATRIDAADLDGDGHPDLVLSGGVPPRVLRNAGPEGFEARETPGAGAALARAADLDADGHRDVVLAGAGSLEVLRGDGRLNFAGARAPAAGAGATPAVALLVADLARDGYPEAIRVARDGTVQVRPNPPGRNHWLGVRLQGFGGRSPRGAEVVLIRKDGSRVSGQVHDDAGVSLGVGRLTQIDLAAVYWPSGRITRSEVKRLDAYVRIAEPDPAVMPRGRRAVGVPIHTPMSDVLECR